MLPALALLLLQQDLGFCGDNRGRRGAKTCVFLCNFSGLPGLKQEVPPCWMQRACTPSGSWASSMPFSRERTQKREWCTLIPRRLWQPLHFACAFANIDGKSKRALAPSASIQPLQPASMRNTGTAEVGNDAGHSKAISR